MKIIRSDGNHWPMMGMTAGCVFVFAFILGAGVTISTEAVLTLGAGLCIAISLALILIPPNRKSTCEKTPHKK